MAELDTNGNGKMELDEFIEGVHGPLNERRQEIIDYIFYQLDSNNSLDLDASEIRGAYNCRDHPLVKSGQMTEQEGFLEFLHGFSDKNRDGKIQRQEWNEYYAAVSADIDNDDHFIGLMRSVWNPAIKVTDDKSEFLWVGNGVDLDQFYKLELDWRTHLDQIDAVTHNIDTINNKSVQKLIEKVKKLEADVSRRWSDG